MIEFAYPLGLLSLLAGVVILVLHLLQPKRRRVQVSTTMLWQAALKDRERGLGLGRLLRSLSLLLLLAAAITLGLGLADPQWLTRTAERADTVLVLDVSASMQTRSGGGAMRFDEALAEAGRILDGLPRDGRMLVMTSGRKAILRSGFESDRGVLRRILGQLRPGDEAGRPREALSLALSLLRNRDQGRIYFVTDGAFDAEADLHAPQVVYRTVGAPARNVAITQFDFRQELASGERFGLLLTVRNYTDVRVAVPASVTLEGRTLFSAPLEVDAGGEKTVVLAFEGQALGRAVARIDVDDDLAADNQAFAVVNAEDTLRVLLYTPGNRYLESLLAASPRVQFDTRAWSPSENLARVARLHDVVVFDGVAAPRLPPGNFVLVDTLAPGLPFSDTGQVTRPGALVRGASALLRGVDLTAVRVDQARRIAVERQAPGLQRLFWSKETDLALALLDADLKLVYLGFDLARSNFALQAAFPLFFSHSLQWLRPRAEGFSPTHIPAGSTYSVRVPSGVGQALVRLPSGDAVPLTVEGGTLAFDATQHSGIYRYSVRAVARYFAVSLADARESDVNVRFVPPIEGAEARVAGAGAQAAVAIWPYLLLLALALLALEWLVWRRSWARA